MSKCRIKTGNNLETRKLGEVIGKLLPSGAIVILSGTLGCGKTELTKGIARAFKIEEDEISSPSFNIVHEYDRLIHIDLYRLSSIEEIEDLGMEDLLGDPRIKVIEWGEPISKFQVSNPVIKIRCSEEKDNKRVFEIEDPTGKICSQIGKLNE